MIVISLLDKDFQNIETSPHVTDFHFFTLDMPTKVSFLQNAIVNNLIMVSVFIADPPLVKQSSQGDPAVKGVTEAAVWDAWVRFFLVNVKLV